MEINVIIVPETNEFLYEVLRENRVWINKKLGKPKLFERNAKYLAPYWLGGDSVKRGVNRIYNILGLTENEESYEIKLGNSFYLKENWLGLDEAQVRRFQYVPLSEFKLNENSEGSLVPFQSLPVIKDVITKLPQFQGQFYDLPNLKQVNPEDKLLKNKKFFEEFWIGKDVDLNKYWTAYHNGNGYIQKFHSMECFVIEISFLNQPREYPLFNFEPIIKTVKAYYYYLKETYLSEEEFNSEGPIYLQEVNRGSEIITLLGGQFAVVLGLILLIEKINGQLLENELKEKKAEGQDLDNKLTTEKIEGQNLENQLKKEKLKTQRLETLAKANELLKTQYPKIYAAHKKTIPPQKIKNALDNLFNEGLGKIRISKSSIKKGDITEAKRDMDEFSTFSE